MITVAELEDATVAKPILRILRHKIDEPTFDARLRDALAQGYKVIAARSGDRIVGALGYRIVQDLCWGKSLFIDDLVVDPAHRSLGVGAQLLSHAREIAARSCDHLRLCSGLNRHDAHRFYETHGIDRASFQFAVKV